MGESVKPTYMFFADPVTGNWLPFTAAFSAVVSGIGISVTTSLKTPPAASAQLLAANAGRSYLLIQNNDPVVTIYIRTGAGASTVNYLAIAPGGSYEPRIAPVDAIQFIGGAAGTANSVVVLEG
jgi:hypothetical protein